jgi:Fe-S cluster assembly protein SufD
MRPLAEVLRETPGSLAQAFEPSAAASLPADQDSLDALNLAFMSDGAVVGIHGGSSGRPLLIVQARTSAAAHHVAGRNLVHVHEGAEVVLVEAHVTLGAARGKPLGSFVTDVSVGEKAHVTHVQCLGSGTASGETHLSRWNVRLAKDARYRGFHLTSDVALARNEVNVLFEGRGARLDMSGCFLGRDSEHIDETLVIDHAVPGCESRELFKGVLEGRARGIFQGKVIVRQDAQKTDGKQMAQALMLSPDAEFDSKPELEIYADDVVCGHGSTAAELDTDLLFYMRARGIPLDQARAMLIESFVGETFDKIENEAVREAVSAVAVGWLHRVAQDAR